MEAMWTGIRNISRLVMHKYYPDVRLRRTHRENSICERLHHNIANIFLQIITREIYEDARQVMENALSACMHAATRCAVNHNIPYKTSPGAPVFSRDNNMFGDVYTC